MKIIKQRYLKKQNNKPLTVNLLHLISLFFVFLVFITSSSCTKNQSGDNNLNSTNNAASYKFARMGDKMSTVDATDIDTLQIPLVVKDYFRALYSTMIKDVDISSTDDIDKMITFYSDPDENPMLAMFAGLDIEDKDSLGYVTKANFLDFSNNEKIGFMYHFQLLEGKRLADKIRAVPSLAENIKIETKILNELSDIKNMRDKFTEFQKRLGKIYNPPIIASARMSSSSSSGGCIEMETFDIDDWIRFINLLRSYYHRGYTI